MEVIMAQPNKPKYDLSSLSQEEKNLLLQLTKEALEVTKSFEKNYPARLQKAREANAKRDPINDSW